MPEAVIVDCLRTPIGKAPDGALRHVRPDEMAATVVRALLEKYPRVAPDDIGDLVVGCAFPELESGMNTARNIAFLAGLPDSVPGVTVNRFCASGLQAIAMASERIQNGSDHVVLAGGTESMSLMPKRGNKFCPNPRLVDTRPEVYLTPGLTAERLQRKYGISREEQDAYALESHRRAMRALRKGLFEDEIVPVQVRERAVRDGEPFERSSVVTDDEIPREDVTIESLAVLKPVFDAYGTVTEGNSGQAADGAAMALIMSASAARELKLKPLARFISFAVAGVPPEIMGIGPVVAIPKTLAMSGLTLADIDLIELNEAFAVQALAVIRLAGLEPARLNVHGGAIALGHPLGCTGARLTATLVREMRRRRARYGMVAMSIAGGQGAAAIFERF